MDKIILDRNIKKMKMAHCLVVFFFINVQFVFSFFFLSLNFYLVEMFNGQTGMLRLHWYSRDTVILMIRRGSLRECSLIILFNGPLSTHLSGRIKLQQKENIRSINPSF